MKLFLGLISLLIPRKRGIVQRDLTFFKKFELVSACEKSDQVNLFLLRHQNFKGAAASLVKT